MIRKISGNMDEERKPWFFKGRGIQTSPSSAITIIVITILITLLVFQTTPPPPPITDDHSSSSSSSDDDDAGKGKIIITIPVVDKGRKTCSGFYSSVSQQPRKVVSTYITEFGGVGDGRTSNTEAFRRAIDHLKQFGDRGGSELVVPKGRWVTGSFNLTSNFTLFLEEGAVILGSQNPKEWPVIEALPSYGRGRERPGGRHISLIHANGVTNVVITGQNGSVDGQGEMWWDMWRNRTLDHTRGHLLELVNSQNILIYNLTFLNSPFWTIHPVYCSDVVIKEVTVLAPFDAPNTDGIDPDSSSNVCIEDCYIESGDDLVAIKSGWDQYGTSMARPSFNITVMRVSGTTPTCSGIGIGSEMSGGIHDITVEDLHVWNSAAGVRIKTDRGRGGYIRNINITNVYLDRVKVPIRFSRGADDHPDDDWDRNALPEIDGIRISDVVGVDIKKAPVLDGLEGTSFYGVCLRNISLRGIPPPARWHCQFVSGSSRDVFPLPCPQLTNQKSSSSSSSSSGCL